VQIWSDGEMGWCGSVNTFDLLWHYDPKGGETVTVRAVYILRFNDPTLPSKHGSIDSAPVTLGWTLHEINNQSLTVTQNGTYTPPEGCTGFSSVTVNVAGTGEGDGEQTQKKYLFQNVYATPYSLGGEVISQALPSVLAGCTLYVEVEGEETVSFTIDAAMAEEMQSSYCRIEVVPGLYYGVDFDANGTAGWFLEGSESVCISMYYQVSEVDGGNTGACLHTSGRYTVFLDTGGTVHLADEESALEDSWAVDVIDADDDTLIEHGTAAPGDGRYFTALNASGKRAYARVSIQSHTMQTNTVFFP
jgi:hypothetical protein